MKFNSSIILNVTSLYKILPHYIRYKTTSYFFFFAKPFRFLNFKGYLKFNRQTISFLPHSLQSRKRTWAWFSFAPFAKHLLKSLKMHSRNRKSNVTIKQIFGKLKYDRRTDKNENSKKKIENHSRKSISLGIYKHAYNEWACVLLLFFFYSLFLPFNVSIINFSLPLSKYQPLE